MKTSLLQKLPVLTAPQLAILVSIFLAVTANQHFFLATLGIYNPTVDNTVFLLSLSALLATLTAMLLMAFSLIMPVRIAASIFILIAAGSGYFADQFGTVIDTSMLQNTFETDTAEAIDLLTFGLLQRFVLLGLLPLIVVWRIPLVERSRWTEWRYRSQGSVFLLLSCIALIAANSDQYASFFREHKSVRSYAIPAFPIYSSAKYMVDFFADEPYSGELTPQAADAAYPAGHAGRELIVMVVGETARADRFSLNGYQRNTNPNLSTIENVVSYSNISACGTSTAVSVPCMFSPRNSSEFERTTTATTENALDVLSRLGVSVLWRDNNSDSKGVATRITYEDFRNPVTNPVCDSECRDVGMLHGLQDYIDGQTGDILIVLHQMGNHGPAYYKRYPKEFEQFTPACQTADISKCSSEQINNAYDNAIRYTDYFLSEVIGLLKANTPAFDTAMLYVSDHGESLGEKGLYLHGMPNLFAPKEQTHVPVIVWTGSSSSIEFKSALALRDTALSHDDVFPSLLTAFEVETDILNGTSTFF